MAAVEVHYEGNPEDVFVARDELLELLNRPAWQRDALCREPMYRHLPWVTYSKGENKAVDQMKHICAQCLCRAECAAFARAVPDPGLVIGVWGGTTQKQRKLTVRDPTPT